MDEEDDEMYQFSGDEMYQFSGDPFLGMAKRRFQYIGIDQPLSIDQDSQPLLWIIGRDYYVETMKKIVKEYPLSAQQRTEVGGYLPLHLAVRDRNQSVEVIQFLVTKYPGGVKERDLSEDGSLALHGACSNEKTSEQTVRLLHKHYPQGVRTRNNKGLLPLHLAAGHTSVAVMRVLGKLCPQAAQINDSVAGCLPLHYAATRGTQTALNAIKYCVQLFPQGVRVKASSNGYLPLHYAAQHYFRDKADTIQYLIAQHPNGTQEQSQDGSLPLHLAALHGRRNLKAVQLLYQKYPDGIRISDHQGYLPLHNLARNTKQAKAECEDLMLSDHYVLPIFQFLVEKYHGALRRKTHEHDYLPLHLALRNRQPGSVIKLLIKHFADAVGTKTTCDEEFFPLHLAASSPGMDVDGKIIQTLIELYPQAVRERTAKTGSLPLHCVANRDMQHKSVIQALVEHYPESIRETNHDGCLLLHLLLSSSEERVKLIQEVVELFPQALKEKDTKGLLPLHYAARQCPTIKVIQYLVEQHPESVREKDKDGCLPLHYAVGNNTDEGLMKIVQYLVEQFPESVREKDHDGNLPLHAALANEEGPVESNFKVIKYLMDQFPDGVREPNASGSLPLHVASRRDQRRYYYYSHLDVIDLLSKPYPVSVQVKDAQGRLPLHIASRYMMHNLDVLHFFMTQYPNGVRDKDVDEYLPLHHALSKSNPTLQCSDAIRLLVEPYPESLQARTKEGWLPIYMLLTSFQQTNLNLIYFCIKSNPRFLFSNQDDAAVNNDANPVGQDSLAMTTD